MKSNLQRATILAALLLLAPGPRPARAGFFCGNCATEWTQVANNLQLISSYIRQGMQLEEEIKMRIDMYKNSLLVPLHVFRPIMADIARLADVVQGGQSLAYSMANLDGEFRNRFRGFGYNARAWFRDYRTWSQTSLDTTLGTLRAAGLQGEQLRSEQAVLNQLRMMAQTSEGRMQALQVANQIAEQSVQQLMKLRQLMMADLQSKQAFQAAQIQREAATEASTERFFNFSGRAGDRRGYQAAR